MTSNVTQEAKNIQCASQRLHLLYKIPDAKWVDYPVFETGNDSYLRACPIM